MKAISGGYSRGKRTHRRSLLGRKRSAVAGMGLLAWVLVSCEPTPVAPPIVKVDEGSLGSLAAAKLAPSDLTGKRLGYSSGGWDCEYRFFADGKYRYTATGDRKKEPAQIAGWTSESASTDSRTGNYQYTRTGPRGANIRFDNQPTIDLAFAGPGTATAVIAGNKVRCEIGAESGGQEGRDQVKSPHELSALCDDATARSYRARLAKSRVPAFNGDKAEVRMIAAAVADGITKVGLGADVWDLTAIRVAAEGAEPEQYSVAWAAEGGIARIDRYCELTRRYWWFERNGVVIGPDSLHQMHLRMEGMFR